MPPQLAGPPYSNRLVFVLKRLRQSAASGHRSVDAGFCNPQRSGCAAISHAHHPLLSLWHYASESGD